MPPSTNTLRTLLRSPDFVGYLRREGLGDRTSTIAWVSGDLPATRRNQGCGQSRRVCGADGACLQTRRVEESLAAADPEARDSSPRLSFGCAQECSLPDQRQQG